MPMFRRASIAMLQAVMTLGTGLKFESSPMLSRCAPNGRLTLLI